MSYEVWGDSDEYDDTAAERFIDAGWWDEDTVLRVKEAVQKLRTEPVYQSGRMVEGISVRFLARMTILDAEVGHKSEDDPLVIEARAILNEPMQS